MYVFVTLSVYIYIYIYLHIQSTILSFKIFYCVPEISWSNRYYRSLNAHIFPGLSSTLPSHTHTAFLPVPSSCPFPSSICPSLHHVQIDSRSICCIIAPSQTPDGRDAVITHGWDAEGRFLNWSIPLVCIMTGRLTISAPSPQAVAFYHLIAAGGGAYVKCIHF